MAAPTKEGLTASSAQVPEQKALPPYYPVPVPVTLLNDLAVVITWQLASLANQRSSFKSEDELFNRCIAALPKGYPDRGLEDTVRIALSAADMNIVDASVRLFPDDNLKLLISHPNLPRRQALIATHDFIRQAFYRASGILPEPVQAAGIPNLAAIRRQSQPQRA